MKKDKCAIFLSICSFIGWLTFVIGFGIHEQHEHGYTVDFQATNAPYWLLAFIGIPGVISHLVYGCSQKRGLGTISLLLNIFMLVCCGAILNESGNIIGHCIQDYKTPNPNITNYTNPFCAFTNTSGQDIGSFIDHNYVQAEFAGAILYTLFQTATVLLFFYRLHESDGYGSLA